MKKLIDMIQTALMENTYKVNILLPYDRGDIFSKIKNKYNVEEFEYVETGIELTVELDEEDYNIYKQYIINE
jgi:GTP-binding protein HflX